jgi:hypothetical protein
MHRSTSLLLALPLVVSLAACTGTTPNADTPKTDGTSAPFQPTVPEGTPVYVNRSGQWLTATVVRQTGPTNVLVHYEGMPADWDEDVIFDRVRSRPVAAPPGADYKAGDVVLVNVQNRIVMAEVAQQVDAGNFRVHYSGYGPEAVQNVPAAQLSRPFAGATAHPAGAAVLVDAGGPQGFPAKVLAAVSADHWLVRLDAGPQYDQVVDAAHLRAADAPPAVTAPPVVTAPPAPTSAPDAGKPPAKPGAKPPAAKPPVVDNTPPAPAPLKAGDAALVMIRSIWYAAKIVGPGAATGSFKVRVEGATADEEIAGAHVARMEEPLKGVKYKVGQAVFVEWHGVYAPGKIVKDAGSANYVVRPDGKGSEADEVIPAKRLRPH